MKSVGLLVGAIAVLFLCSAAHATTWYVHPDSTLNSIQAGIDLCSTGDTVLVGPGTYIENINFNGMAITVTSEYGADTTIIDGSNPAHPDTGSVVLFVSGEDTSSVLQGFTITNGSGTGIGLYHPQGGGVYCLNNSSPTIIDNVITGNTAFWGGGGISCYYNCSPIIDGNVISNNVTDTAGGGVLVFNMSAPVISNNTISMNESQWCSGLYIVNASHPEITNNDILNNTATLYGGGIGITWGSAPTVSDNTIRGNKAYTGGGGILCGESSSPVIMNCTIEYDTAYSPIFGGGINISTNSSPTIEKCTISYNSSVGVSCQNCTTSIDSSTISHNTLHGIRCNIAYVVINYCNIYSNAGYGVLNGYLPITINAEHNWWGDSTGPYHPTSNPGGLGDSVSDYVDFDPWIGQTGIRENIHLQPARIVLHINPNPFCNRTEIRYTIHDTGYMITDMVLKIFDATGRLVKDFRITPDALSNTLYWDGRDGQNRMLGSGVYFVKFAVSPVGTTGSGGEAGGYTETKKLLLIK